jgi:5-methylcytosine-specific restriction endonuclease McrA
MNEVPQGLDRDEFREWYRCTYLNSQHWREFAAEIRKQYQFKCQQCGDKAYDVHHVNYRFYNEKITDVKLWCRMCHDLHHENKRNGTQLTKMAYIEQKLKEHLS